MSKEVTDVAKRQQGVDTGEKVLSTGVRVHIHPVASRLLTECMTRVPKPPVPMWFDPERGREVPNPIDPEYLRALDERSNRQNNVVMDALVMFGMELVDEGPLGEDGWVKKLRLLEKTGVISLEDYDLNDPVDREFVYKRFVAVSAADMPLLQQASGVVAEEDLAAARDSFPGVEVGGAD